MRRLRSLRSRLPLAGDQGRQRRSPWRTDEAVLQGILYGHDTLPLLRPLRGRLSRGCARDDARVRMVRLRQTPTPSQQTAAARHRRPLLSRPGKTPRAAASERGVFQRRFQTSPAKGELAGCRTTMSAPRDTGLRNGAAVSGTIDGPMDHIFFFYFAGIIATTSLLVVALRNPVYSALALLIMFFHVAGLYVTLHAEFLAAVQIVVYAGAILVLYLFVVMLLNVKAEERYHNQLPVAGLLGVMLLTEVILLIIQSRSTSAPAVAADPVTSAGNTETIGEVLYSTYLFPFEVASLILLVAMIGAIILAKKDIFEGSGDA